MNERTTAADWYENAADFRLLCNDAQAQARTAADQEIAADMYYKSKQYGLNAFVSIRQLRWLCRIAQHDLPQRRGR